MTQIKAIGNFGGFHARPGGAQGGRVLAKSRQASLSRASAPTMAWACQPAMAAAAMPFSADDGDQIGQQRPRRRHVVEGAELVLKLGQPGRELLGGFPVGAQRQQEISHIAQFLHREAQPVALLRRLVA